MIDTEEYNPKIHCCEYWYKDFCTCIKDSMKEYRARKKSRNINGTLRFLKKNKIKYHESNIPNIIIINPETDYVNVSLKKNGNLIKCRFKNSSKWYLYSKNKFLETFKK